MRRREEFVPDRRHVVLVTYGEPPRPSFPAQLRYSWRLLVGLTRTVASLPAASLPLLAVARASARVASWRRERFQSPLEPITHAQAEGLAAALAAAAPGVGWNVSVAYEFRDPLLADVLASLPPGEPVDVVPMYAVDSAFTHQLARKVLGRMHRLGGRPRSARVLPPLSTSGLAELAVAHVRAELRRRLVRCGEDTALVLVAHGTLANPSRGFETGRAATEQLAEEISRRLRAEFGAIVLGWLNQSLGGPWTQPSAERALREVVERGYRRVIYFPFGFLADNAESLLEGRRALRAEPSLEAIHLSCWNAAPELMTAIARQVIGATGPLPVESGGERRERPASHEGSSRGRARLDQLEPGEGGVIERLEGNSGIERRLMELGLVPGTPVEVVRRAPFGDPVEIRIRDVSLSLRRTETSRIHVAPR